MREIAIGRRAPGRRAQPMDGPRTEPLAGHGQLSDFPVELAGERSSVALLSLAGRGVFPPIRCTEFPRPSPVWKGYGTHVDKRVETRRNEVVDAASSCRPTIRTATVVVSRQGCAIVKRKSGKWCVSGLSCRQTN